MCLPPTSSSGRPAAERARPPSLPRPAAPPRTSRKVLLVFTGTWRRTTAAFRLARDARDIFIFSRRSRPRCRSLRCRRRGGRSGPAVFATKALRSRGSADAYAVFFRADGAVRIFVGYDACGTDVRSEINRTDLSMIKTPLHKRNAQTSFGLLNLIKC